MQIKYGRGKRAAPRCRHTAECTSRIKSEKKKMNNSNKNGSSAASFHFAFS